MASACSTGSRARLTSSSSRPVGRAFGRSSSIESSKAEWSAAEDATDGSPRKSGPLLTVASRPALTLMHRLDASDRDRAAFLEQLGAQLLWRRHSTCPSVLLAKTAHRG